MRKGFVIGLFTGIVVVVAFLAGVGVAKAQNGQIVFLGATSGTTLAANCPATPATPSQCVVGDGVWIWQNSTQGWFKAGPPTASGVVSFNGRTGVVVPIPTDYPDTVTSVNGKTGAVVLSIQ